MIDPRSVPDSWGYNDFDDESENHKSKLLTVTYPTLVKENKQEDYRKLKVSPNFTLFRPGSYKGFVVETDAPSGKQTHLVESYMKALVVAKGLYESCLKDGWHKR